jgi:nitrogen fixation NifU-like protein
MLDDLRELYQEIILDHGRAPRNFRRLEDATCHAHGQNPMCGDILEVFLKLDPDGVVQDVAFVGKGCAISMASASLMTETLKGKSRQEAETLFRLFHAQCTGEGEQADPADDNEDVERLQVLAGVRAFPVRVKCATLAWHTMHAALTGVEQASTE